MIGPNETNGPAAAPAPKVFMGWLVSDSPLLDVFPDGFVELVSPFPRLASLGGVAQQTWFVKWPALSEEARGKLAARISIAKGCDAVEVRSELDARGALPIGGGHFDGVVVARAGQLLLKTWAVFCSPVDFRGRFVVRLFINGCPTGTHWDGSTIEAVRARLPQGLTRIERLAGDEPQIVETWQ